MTNLGLALRARRHGAHYSLRIVQEAKRAGIPVSLGFALVEQESGFRNVFGHDPTIYIGAGPVTKRRYLAYKSRRGRYGMQGVGLTQLTWWELQDEADRRGGCWVPRVQLRVAFEHLARLVKEHGVNEGIRRYNGTGPAAERYRSEVIAKHRKWHKRLV